MLVYRLMRLDRLPEEDGPLPLRSRWGLGFGRLRVPLSHSIRLQGSPVPLAPGGNMEGEVGEGRCSRRGLWGRFVNARYAHVLCIVFEGQVATTDRSVGEWGRISYGTQRRLRARISHFLFPYYRDYYRQRKSRHHIGSFQGAPLSPFNDTKGDELATNYYGGP